MLDTDDTLEAAKHLVRAYVERGDSLDSLRSGVLGAASPQSYWASISGYLGNKKYNSDHIIVYRDMKGKEVNKVFKLKKIVEEIKGEMLNGQKEELHSQPQAKGQLS